MGLPWEGYNQSEAFSSLNNMNNASVSINLSNYTAIQNMTNSTALDSPDTAVNALFTPINSFWISPSGWGAWSGWGSWFYVLLIIFTVGTVYIRSQSLHRTSIVMLFLSLLAVAPGASGALYIPATALHVLYVFTGVAFAGVLYSFWVGD